MAYTVTLLYGDVSGSQRMNHYKVVADAVSGVVTTGLQYVYNATLSPNSMTTTNGIQIHLNTGAASAVVNGSLFISGVASGDQFTLAVYGR